MTSFSCQAIFFDLDGTLVDSMKCVEYAWQTWCLEHNIDSHDFVRRFSGHLAVDIVRTLRPALDSAKEKAKIDTLELSQPEKLIPIRGAREITNLLAPHHWGIVTSSTANLASYKLKYAQINEPNIFITADHLTEGKPHPQGYLKAAAMLGVDPKQCVAFEDVPNGIKAARAAGMKVIALTTTHPVSDLHEADACIENYENLELSINSSGITISVKSKLPITSQTVHFMSK